MVSHVGVGKHMGSFDEVPHMGSFPSKIALNHALTGANKGQPHSMSEGFKQKPTSHVGSLR